MFWKHLFCNFEGIEFYFSSFDFQFLINDFLITVQVFYIDILGILHNRSIVQDLLIQM